MELIVERVGEVLKSTRGTSDYRYIILKDFKGKQYRGCVFVNRRSWDDVIAAGPGTVVQDVVVRSTSKGLVDGSSCPTIVRRLS